MRFSSLSLLLSFPVLLFAACQNSEFQSEYFDFAKDSDEVEFKAEIKQVPDHVDDNMVYFCRTGEYNNRQVVYKGVLSKNLILSAYKTTGTRVIWNKEVPEHRYIAEIIVPEPDEELLYSEFQQAVDQKFGISASEELQTIEVLELHNITSKPIGFEETDDSEVKWSQEDGYISGVGINMGMLARIIERVSKEKPVFNAIEGTQRYAIDIEWEPGNIEELNSLLSESGLELVTKKREVKVLVVN
jgi:hypothetical protein